MTRKYYSQRHSTSAQNVSLEDMRRVLGVVFDELYENKYLCENLDVGCCVDEQDKNLSGTLLKTLRKDLWPIRNSYNETDGKLDTYTQEDIFDLIEFLFDHVSAPVHLDGDHYHSWGECGYHYSKFSKEKGQQQIRDDFSDLLEGLEEGYELNTEGEIVRSADQGIKKLLDAKKIEIGKGDIPARMAEAEKLFYAARSSITDRKNAVKELADCFEYVREDVKKALQSKDEADLFNLANNFGIRHHNEKQKTNYDQNIWLSWMFHFYLATLHASLRLIEKNKHDKS